MPKPTGAPQAAPVQTMFDEAVKLQRQGDHKGALRHFRKILERSSDHPQSLNHYAISLAEMGDLIAARKALEQAVASAPDYADGWLNLGMVQNQTQDIAAAASSFDKLRILVPNSPVSHIKYAEACLKLERYEESFKAYKRGLDLDPGDLTVWRNFAWVCLYAGDWDMACEAADKVLQEHSGHTSMLSFKAIAYLESGKLDELAALVDFDRLIETKTFSPPDDFANLETFNAALNSHCLKHPNLKFEPSGKSTTKGHQTTRFNEDQNLGPVAALLELINQAVRDYQDSHPIDAAHPFLARQPGRWSINIWGTVLGSQGHQASHIHPSGWLSGVYYSKIPDIITADAQAEDGWIEFGHPHKYPKAVAEPVVRSCQPHEGMVVLFPSYFYHRTKPFESEDQRISIAFDIVPSG